MSKTMETTRRSFLKSGALVAAPVAAVAAPAMALAADNGSARLARLEDERAIEALSRNFVRNFNASGAKGTADLFAAGRAPELGDGAVRLALDAAGEPDLLEVAEDGAHARSRHLCTLESEYALEGEGSLVEMARLQGNSAVQTSEQRVLVADYVKLADGWAIESLRLA